MFYATFNAHPLLKSLTITKKYDIIDRKEMIKMLHEIFYGVSEFEKNENGVLLPLRLPKNVMQKMSAQGQAQCRNTTGTELRFVINSGKVKITFFGDENTFTEATVFYGDFVADWSETVKRISGKTTEVTFVQSDNIELLRKIAKQYNHRFSPDVVRVQFSGNRPQILKIDGDISIPTKDMLPKRKYLAYGSSITHGSISLNNANDYVSRVGEFFGADSLNMGFAGSACLEREVADYIAEKCKFDFATLEMGINILEIDVKEFEDRVRYFVKRIAVSHPDSKIFAIDVFYCKSDICSDGKAELFRNTVKKVTEELKLPNVIYVNGTEVLKDAGGLSSGLVHPNPRGIENMANNLCKIIAKSI